MTPPPRTTMATAVALAATLLLPGWAQADIRNEGGGNYNDVPLYRAFTFAGLDRDNDGGYLADDVDGLDYVSNIAPRTLATANVQVQADGTNFSGSGWSAWSGFYAARSFATMTVSNASEDQRYYVVAGQGSATSVQFFTPEAAASRAVFTWRVTGSQTDPIGSEFVSGRLDFAATTDAGHSWLDLFDGGFDDQLTEFGTGTFTYSLPVADLGTPIYLHYWSSAFAEVLGGQVPGGSNFTATADYSHTVVLEDVQLLDANDVALNEWTLQDLALGETVFDQSGRVAGILPPPIPEPGTWALMVAGLIGIGRHVGSRRQRS